LEAASGKKGLQQGGMHKEEKKKTRQYDQCNAAHQIGRGTKNRNGKDPARS